MSMSKEKSNRGDVVGSSTYVNMSDYNINKDNNVESNIQVIILKVHYERASSL